MNVNMRRLTSLLLTVCMVLALAACGDKTADPDAGDASASRGEAAPPEAGLDPAEIEWGYQSRDIMDAQYWYPDGDKTQSSFLIFEDDYLTVVDGAAREMFDTRIVDQHIVDAETEGEVFDFVFTDVLTCYDLVGGQWYMRADYEAVVSSLTAAAFVCEDDSQCTFAFSADGTFLYTEDGETATGTWWFDNARTIDYRFDDETSTIWFEVTYDDASWDIVSLRDLDTFYPES